MIKLGSNSIGKIYLGSNSIGKAYLGSNLVFQKGSSPTPSIQPVFYDRLVFDGTAYIETGITPPADASFLVRLGNETVNGAQRCFLCPSSNDGYIGITYGNNANSRYFNVYYGQASTVSSTHYLAFSTTTYNFFLTPNRFGWGNNTSYTFTRGAENAAGSLILGSNISHNGQPYTGTMDEFKIYGSDAQNVTNANDFSSYTPVYTLRPCTYNGEAGMWCVETSTFYGNTAGEGTLSVLNNS